jgi:ligand-binding sensor domain-containing protein
MPLSTWNNILFSLASRLKLALFFCFSLLSTVSVFTQNLQFKNHPLSIEGISNMELTCLTHTQDGMLWIGSSKGLISYNGIDYQLFMTDTTVSALFEDSKKRLWIGLKNGKIFNFNKKKIQEWVVEEGHPAVPITGFGEDKNGRIWIATYGEGAYVYDNKRLYNFNLQDSLTSNDVYDIFVKNNEAWLATDQGISICSFENGKKKAQKKGAENGLPDLIVKSFTENKEHNLQTGYYDGSVCNGFFLDEKVVKVEGAISSLAVDVSGTYFIGTEENGLYVYDKNAKILKSIPPSVLGRNIRDLALDDEGNIWIISDRNKLYSNDLRFTFYNTTFKNIQTINHSISTKNKMIIGTQKGAFEYDITTGISKNILPENINVLSTFEDFVGNKWFGTFGQGLYCLTAKDNKLLHFTEKDGLSNLNIFSINAQDDTLWLATLGGIFKLRFEGQKAIFQNFNKKNGLSTDFIYCISEDNAHRIRIGTDGNGLSLFDGQNFQNISEFQNTPIGAVVSIADDNDKHIWLATLDGRILYETDKPLIFKELQISKNRNQNIVGLTRSANGFIVVFKSSGIDLINSRTHELIPFGADVNLGDLSVGLNVFTFDISPRAHTGNLWFATSTGLVKMDANVPQRAKPTMILKGVNIFMQPIDYEQVTHFKYDQNYLNFDFEGVWLTNPSAVRYRYKLEGLDLDWQATREQQITYPNLPAGSYTFKVQSSLTDDFNMANEANYTFKIGQPFWTTWWFILLSIATISALVYYVVKLRETRLKREDALSHAREQAEFEMLKSQINPHFLFNSFNTLIATIETDPTTAVEFTEKLSDLYRNILQVRDRDLIPLSEELDLLNNFIYLLKKRFGDALIFNIKVDNLEAQIVPLALQLLVENAVKHNTVSKLRPLKIDIIETDGWLEIRNNIQKKLEHETEAKGTGFGLASLTRRYALLSNKNIEIKQGKEDFIVRIPLVNG